MGVELNFLVCFCQLAELAFVVPVVHEMVENAVITIQKGLVLKLVFLHRPRRVLQTQDLLLESILLIDFEVQLCFHVLLLVQVLLVLLLLK